MCVYVCVCVIPKGDYFCRQECLHMGILQMWRIINIGNLKNCCFHDSVNDCVKGRW